MKEPIKTGLRKVNLNLIPEPEETKDFIRVDRSIVQQINDIHTNFGEDSQLVLSILLFFQKVLKANFFFRIDFTIEEFCRKTGYNKFSLCREHPIFKNDKTPIPKLANGHEIKSIFDYTLYIMYQRSIVFPTGFTYTVKKQRNKMEKLEIMKTLEITTNTTKKNQKQYHVTLSEEIYNGFLSRYYIMNYETFKQLGKGKGGFGRQQLYMLIQVEVNKQISMKENYQQPIIPVDNLIKYVSSQAKEPKHKKEAVKKTLDSIIKIDPFYSYKFIPMSKNSLRDYGVAIIPTFTLPYEKLLKEHEFTIEIFERLRNYYMDYYIKEHDNSNEVEDFYGWLINKNLNSRDKALIIKSVIESKHYKNLKEISLESTLAMILGN